MPIIAGFVLFGLIHAAVSQYECTPGYCSQNNGLDRGDVLGCRDFCYFDVNGDLLLQRTEFQTRFDEWRGDASVCDYDCFYAALFDIIPACDDEYLAVYDWQASLDGDATSISTTDMDLWYNVLVTVQGGAPITSDAFQRWWLAMYEEMANPNCDVPFP